MLLQLYCWLGDHHSPVWRRPVDNRTEDNAFSIAPSDTVLGAPCGYDAVPSGPPGRGQVINQQTWKVRVIYSLFAGVVAYGVYTHDHVLRLTRGSPITTVFPDDTRFAFRSDSFIHSGRDNQPRSIDLTETSSATGVNLTLVGVLLGLRPE